MLKATITTKLQIFLVKFYYKSYFVHKQMYGNGIVSDFSCHLRITFKNMRYSLTGYNMGQIMIQHFSLTNVY